MKMYERRRDGESFNVTNEKTANVSPLVIDTAVLCCTGCGAVTVCSAVQCGSVP